MLQERILEMVRFNRRDVYVGSDATATVHRASAVSELHLAVRRVGALGALAVVVVVVQRDVAVIALNQPSARSVVVSGRKSQTGIFRQRIDGLHQTFAEGHFAGNQTAVVILD